MKKMPVKMERKMVGERKREGKMSRDDMPMKSSMKSSPKVAKAGARARAVADRYGHLPIR